MKILFYFYFKNHKILGASLNRNDKPTTISSGTSIRTKSKISKAGSKLYRGTLFMSALVAVMRKIIIITHSLYKNNQ
jgi:hypothetical protein